MQSESRKAKLDEYKAVKNEKFTCKLLTQIFCRVTRREEAKTERRPRRIHKKFERIQEKSSNSHEDLPKLHRKHRA